MNQNLFLAAAVSAVVLLAACQRQDATRESRPSESAQTADETNHAPAGAAPGSHEDWCGEHQVPESMCTRCNPSLIAAFKATGDWCPEHGVPESQCKLCNPDLEIERPAKTQGAK